MTRSEVFGEKKEEQISGLEILNKLIANIIKNPTDPKFRTIKRSNKTIQTKLLVVQPQVTLFEMLEILGYVDNTEDDSFVFVGDYFMVLKRGYAFIEEAITKLKQYEAITEENKAKMKKYAEDLAKFKQEKADRDEQKRRILEWTQ